MFFFIFWILLLGLGIVQLVNAKAELIGRISYHVELCDFLFGVFVGYYGSDC